MASTGEAQPPTEELKNMQIDPVTGESVSKSECESHAPNSRVLVLC